MHTNKKIKSTNIFNDFILSKRFYACKKRPDSSADNCQGVLRSQKYLTFPVDPLSDNILPVHTVLQDSENGYCSSTLIHRIEQKIIFICL